MAQYRGLMSEATPDLISRPKSEPRSVGSSWADIDVESEEELNSQGHEPDPLWSDARSDGVSSTSRSADAPASSTTTPVSSNNASFERLPKLLRKKLQNRALSKDQLSELPTTPTPGSERSSNDARNDRAMLLPVQMAAGDQGAASMDETTSNSGSGFDESSAESSGQNVSGQMGIPSVGSARHDQGACKPCLFVHTEVGCQNGTLCEFCHLPHKRKSKPRPCKGKRDRYRRLLMRMEADANAQDGSDARPLTEEERKELADMELEASSELGSSSRPGSYVSI